ncbi:MAG: NERD domain-containing protein, partial [Clostridia bacterium]|nr:NERD domain-containing protein [Clostridia bacterium]
MEKYDEIYKYLTGVDIRKETNLWDERGKGYYGEFLVFCKLFDSLPAPSKILMNVHVPTGYGTTTEVDLLAITPVGIIVYEVKHY